MPFKCGTMVCPKLENRYRADGNILLIAQIFVADDQQIESLRFSRAQQIAIFEFVPTHLKRSPHFVFSERLPDLSRRAMVQKNPHCFSSAAILCQPNRNTACASDLETPSKESRK